MTTPSLSLLQNLDEQTFIWLLELSAGRDWLATLSVFVGTFGLPIVLILFVFLWLLGAKHKNRAQLASVLASALIARFIFKEIIVVLWSRPRPFEVLGDAPLIGHDPGGAFPSGHATLLFALAAGIWKHDKKMGALFGVLAILTSLGRVLAGIHWPGDVLGGILLGVLTVAVTYGPLKRFIERFF